jgi:hypothetical protein
MPGGNMHRVTEGLIKARSFLKEPKDLARGIRVNEAGGHCPLGLLDLAFGYDPANYDWPHNCSWPYQRAILALALAVPTKYREQGIAEYRDRDLPEGFEDIAPAAHAVVEYANNSDFKMVCHMFDQAIAVRMMSDALKLIPA